MLPACFIAGVMNSHLDTLKSQESRPRICLHNLARHSTNFLRTTQAFWPPKPKALDNATFTSRSLASLGT